MNGISDRWKNGIACMIALTGIGFLYAGALRGENAVIFRKAVTICMECIGIG